MLANKVTPMRLKPQQTKYNNLGSKGKFKDFNWEVTLYFVDSELQHRDVVGYGRTREAAIHNTYNRMIQGAGWGHTDLDRTA